jgi:predicted ferric reductase
MTREMTSSTKSGTVKLRLYRVFVILVFLVVFCGALSIPFVYESQTLWYKIGLDKTMLLGGQLLGLLAAVLLFVQILLGARGNFLKQLFGIAALMRWHRSNGIIISFLAISHVALILIPEGLTNFPIGLKYWPEMVGSLLLWVILSMSISSQFRQEFGLNYKRWRYVHKLLGYLTPILLVTHMLFASESFEQTVPKVALITTFVAVVVSVILSKKSAGQRKE